MGSDRIGEKSDFRYDDDEQHVRRKYGNAGRGVAEGVPLLFSDTSRRNFRVRKSVQPSQRGARGDGGSTSDTCGKLLFLIEYGDVCLFVCFSIRLPIRYPIFFNRNFRYDVQQDAGYVACEVGRRMA